MEQLGDVGLDYYGATGGAEWRTRYALADGRSLVMGTSLALRYALGVGEVAGVQVDPSAATRALALQADTTDLRVHVVSLHIGSTVQF